MPSVEVEVKPSAEVEVTPMKAERMSSVEVEVGPPMTTVEEAGDGDQCQSPRGS